MANLEPALALVLKNEGGFVDDPDDTPTNFGITKAVYETYKGRGVTVAEVKAMPIVDAKAIYATRYWRGVRGAELKDQTLANFVFDLSVLRGTSAGVKSLQTAVGTVADGIFGPKTLAAVNAAAPGPLLNRFRRECVRAFVGIATSKPVKLKFLANWVGRAEKITDAVS